MHLRVHTQISRRPAELGPTVQSRTSHAIALSAHHRLVQHCNHYNLLRISVQSLVFHNAARSKLPASFETVLVVRITTFAASATAQDVDQYRRARPSQSTLAQITFTVFVACCGIHKCWLAPFARSRFSWPGTSEIVTHEQPHQHQPSRCPVARRNAAFAWKSYRRIANRQIRAPPPA